MPNTYQTLGSLFTAIANAIRGKTGGSASIKADDFPSAIGAIPTGVDPSGATALAGDILYPKKAVLADGQLTEGTIPSQAAQTIYPSTSDQTIAAGKYLSGAQTVKGVVVSNTLIAANVADGVTVTIGDADDPDRIMEVVGTHQGGGGDADLDDFVKGTLTALVTDATSIRNYAAYNDSTLQSVSAAEATSVGERAFTGCSALTSASLPKVTSIGSFVFQNLANLASVSIPLCTSLGSYAFAGCQKGVLSAALKATTLNSYAMNSFGKTAATGFAWEPASNATASDYAFAGSRITSINGKVTYIGSYAFDGCEWLESYANTATLSTLSQYAFRNAGKSRADTTVALALDFHTGTFGNVPQYAFAGLVNAIVTLPSIVNALAANAFNGIADSLVIITGNTPTLSATTVFSGAKNSFVAIPYNNYYAATQAANWNAISSMLVGYAPAGTFTAGNLLPTADSGSHDIYWTTNPDGTGWVTECPSGSPILYAHIGTKTGWWIDVDVTGATVTVTADGVAYAITDGRATVPQTAQSIDIGVTYPSGWDTSITLNGVAVTQFPITGLAARDYTLAGRAYDPSQGGVDWATDDWSLVQLTSKNGMTAQTYGSQVGATRTITLTNNTTMTIRLSNADNTMYARSDGSGTTGLCMDFVDCFPDTYYMNSNGYNTGGWNACQMRTVKMAQLFDLLPSDLAAVIETADIPTANNGTGTVSVIDSEDKLFLLAEKEVFGTRTYSVAAEADALTQWAWYAAHNTKADRVKKRNGSASSWWLRSPNSGNSYNFCLVTSDGSANNNDANNSYGVSPAFVI